MHIDIGKNRSALEKETMKTGAQTCAHNVYYRCLEKKGKTKHPALAAKLIAQKSIHNG